MSQFGKLGTNRLWSIILRLVSGMSLLFKEL